MDSDRGNIVNFSSFGKTGRAERKREAKKLKEEQAAANRVRFGRTGAEKKRTKLERKREVHALEGKRLDDRAGESRKPDSEDSQES
ncbi:MAG: DUF4169 family protein [Parvibaculum sp.]